jgi:sugar phosphate isomerase/epimerase
MKRRDFLKGMGVAAAGAVLAGSARAASDGQDGCTLSFGTYGMKKLAVEKAVSVIADTGYDGVEITVRPDWDSAPARMDAVRRKAVRDLLCEKNLKLTALMEHLPPAKDDVQHGKDLERLRGVVQLANDLCPDAPPLIQTVLGGGEWEACRERFRDRLADWIQVGKDGGCVIAIKPHRGGCMSRPSEAVWLIQQLDDSRWLRMVYDYSHYAFRDMPMAETIATALPYTVHIAVKDAVERDGKVAFLLPGEEAGAIDYVGLLRQFHAGGYRGDVCCEVSGMVWSKPDYDPVRAAKVCHANLERAFKDAEVPRGG